MSLSEPHIRHKLSVSDYYRMGDAGILDEDDRVELIEGELIDMAPIGSHHAGIVAQLVAALAQALAGKAIVWPQNLIRLDSYSVPQPDIIVLKTRPDFYKNALPEPADVLLLIEVADTTLDYDRNTKVPLYARHGIVEAWLVDINARQLERYHQPAETGYGQKDIFTPQQAISPLALPWAVLDLAAVLN
ncbi:MAG: Uma2 family endonuclease [Candidatus Paceibacterota bacterium]